MYKIHELEDALVAAIRAAGIAARPYNLAPEDKDLERETSERPVALVVFGGAEAATGRTFSHRSGMDFFFHVYAAARNLRGIAATQAVRGDAANPGIYHVLDGLRGALGGNAFGLLVQPMLFVSENAVSRTPRLNVYRQEWKLTVCE
jgi:hypothetical protein